MIFISRLPACRATRSQDVRPALEALFAGAAFVLLICCVNVAGLLVARAEQPAEGDGSPAGFGCFAGPAFCASYSWKVSCFACSAAFSALFFGWAGFHGLLAIRPERLSGLDNATLSWPVLAFAALSCLSAAMLFGIAPALESFRLDLVATLRAHSRSWLGRLHRRSGHGLVIGEVVLAFMLVTAAALTARTLSYLQRVHPGFEPHNLLAFQIGGLKGNEVAGWESRLAALPGVDRIGAISHLPLDTDIPNWYSPYQPETPRATAGVAFISDLRCVTPGYFSAIGAHLLAGRYFNEQDRSGSEQVVIVDDLLARSTWPGESALGKKLRAEHVTESGFRPIPSIVVGVVAHVYNHSLTKTVRGQIYLPYEQSPRNPLTFVLRTSLPPLSLVPAIRRMLHNTNKFAAMAKVRPMSEYVAREISPSSFIAVLSAVFAGLALLLAMTGIYGVLNYQISQRMPEIGMRMALGASSRDIVRLIFHESLALLTIGLVLGTAGALLIARWLASFLYGVSPQDPLSFALALLVLPAAVFFGSLRPAVRAARANPAEMIRAE